MGLAPLEKTIPQSAFFTEVHRRKLPFAERSTSAGVPKSSARQPRFRPEISFLSNNSGSGRFFRGPPCAGRAPSPGPPAGNFCISRRPRCFRESRSSTFDDSFSAATVRGNFFGGRPAESRSEGGGLRGRRAIFVAF